MTLKKVGWLPFAMAGLLAMVSMIPPGGLTAKTAEAPVDTVQTFPGGVSSQSECRCGPGCECESCTCTAASSATGAEALEVSPEWVRSVYKVRVVGGRGITHSGTGVAVREQLIHTCSHFLHELPLPHRWEVEVDGEWRPAVARAVSGKDLAAVAVEGVTLSPVKIRAPEYGECCTVYGLKTKSSARGVYIGDQDPAKGQGHVALDPGEMTTEPGDSGGGVFADSDGAMLGTLTGHEIPVTQIVAMTPIESASKPVAKAVATRATQQVAAPMNCPGGVCVQNPPPTTQQVRQYFQPQQSRGFFGRRR